MAYDDAVDIFPDSARRNADRPVLLGVMLALGMAACVALVTANRRSVSNYARPAVAIQPVVGQVKALKPWPRQVSKGPSDATPAEAPVRPQLMPGDQTHDSSQAAQSLPDIIFWGPLAVVFLSFFTWVASRLPSQPLSQRIALASVTSHFGRDPYETPEAAEMRRSQESAEVERRVTYFNCMEELRGFLQAAPKPNHLFVVDIEPDSDEQCDVFVEDSWGNPVKSKEGNPCVRLRHSFARTARNCNDATFLALVADGGHDSTDVLARLEVTKVPSVVFIKGDRVVFRHEGVEAANEDLAEGVAYYGDQYADGAHVSDLVPDLHTLTDVQEWTAPPPGESADVLRVVTVLTTTGDTCVHLYPAITSVARQLKGKASFSRLIGDEGPAAKEMLQKLNVKFVPTMLVFDPKTGQEIARYVTGSRSEWMVNFLDEMDKAKASLY